MDIEKRKREILEIALKEYSNGGRIYKIINDNCLDHIIYKITDKKTFTNSKAIVKKGYLTGNEQFIDLLSELIHYFDSSFTPLKHKDWYICCILENKSPKFLLCKNYWGNNNFIEYYKYNIRKCIVENIYDNIKYIYDEYYDFFKKLNIKKNLSLRNISSVNLIYNFAIDLIWCNCNTNQYSFNVVFSNHKFYINNLMKNYSKTMIEADNITYKHYSIQWENLIEKYEKNIDFVKKLLQK